MQFEFLLQFTVYTVHSVFTTSQASGAKRGPIVGLFVVRRRFGSVLPFPIRIQFFPLFSWMVFNGTASIHNVVAGQHAQGGISTTHLVFLFFFKGAPLLGLWFEIHGSHSAIKPLFGLLPQVQVLLQAPVSAFLLFDSTTLVPGDCGV